MSSEDNTIHRKKIDYRFQRDGCPECQDPWCSGCGEDDGDDNVKDVLEMMNLE